MNLKAFLALFCIITLGSCASKKQVVPGYDHAEVAEFIKKLEGKSRFEAAAILGPSAIQGRCKKLCGHPDVYRMIYPFKDMSRFYLDIMKNTDVVVDCHVFDFLPDRKLKKFIFSKKHYRTAKACNQKDGEIILLDTHGILERY